MSNEPKQTMILFLNADQTAALFQLQLDIIEALESRDWSEVGGCLLDIEKTYGELMGPIWSGAFENVN